MNQIVQPALARRIRMAVLKLQQSGEIQSGLTSLSWPKAPEKVRQEIEAIEHVRAHLVLGVVNQIFGDAELGSMVLELMRKYEFEIKVRSRKVVGTRLYGKYVFTCRGPLIRVYSLEGTSHRPKKDQLPMTETLISLEELVVRADSAMDFQQKLYNFLDKTVGEILVPRTTATHS